MKAMKKRDGESSRAEKETFLSVRSHVGRDCAPGSIETRGKKGGMLCSKLREWNNQWRIKRPLVPYALAART